MNRAQAEAGVALLRKYTVSRMPEVEKKYASEYLPRPIQAARIQLKRTAPGSHEADAFWFAIMMLHGFPQESGSEGSLRTFVAVGLMWYCLKNGMNHGNEKKGGAACRKRLEAGFRKRA